jgi:CDP-glucose 4,6-dehydratase
MILNDFYRNKKVLITGHTGFKGSWLTLMLKELGAKITGIALTPKTPEDFFIVNQVDKICNSIIHNINDFHFLQQVVADFQPDLIFHLAAQPLVRHSYAEPLETFQTNVIGTANIMESLKSVRQACAVVVITTDKVYENFEKQEPYAESERLGGKDPYSASKACSELVVASYRDSFFHPDRYNSHLKAVASARAGNVIGGGDWSDDRLVPDIIRAIRKNEEIIIRNPDAVRPWQHVVEPLYGYLLLGSMLYNEPGHYSGAWNFGPYPDDIIRVEELVKTAIRLMGTGNYRISKDEAAPPEATLLRLDISKALHELNWKPRLSMNEAVSLTLKWYRELSRDAGALRNYSVQSIHDYLDRVQS